LIIIRFNLISYLFIYIVFGIVDIFTNPLSRHLSWVLCPIMLAVFLFTFKNFFKKFIYPVLILYSLMIAIGVIVAMIINSNITFIYYSGLVLVVVMSYIGFRIPFIYSSITGVIIFIIYEVSNIFLKKEIGIFINESFLLLIVNSLGMITNFFLEYYMRHSFLLRKRIQYEEELKKEKAKKEISKIKKERDFIKKINTLKNDFIANMSHEIRTPLTLIIGPLETILSKEYGEVFKYDDVKIKTMYYSSLRLLKLINNILDFSKIDAGKLRVEKKKINISKLLQFYIDSVKSSIENRGLVIKYIDNVGVKFIVNTDINILEKAVFNLISNALKFTPEGGQIIILLDKRENCYNISIKDTGIGIPKDKINKIFDRFHQLDNQISRKYEGTGIGLALTKELVEKLGGQILVKSKLHEGSTFTITIPYEKIEDNDIDVNENNYEIKSYLLPDFKNNNKFMNNNLKIFESNKKIILVVEDNPDMQSYIYSILDRYYIVKIARNGIEGLEKIYKNKPDLILADVMMPEMDGYKMTEIIKSREELKGIPVIILTAKSDLFKKLIGFKKGADDYIVKPFNTKELLARIEAHLNIKKLRDETIIQKDDLQKVLNEKIITQKQLEESEKRFREMAENIPIAIMEINKKDKIYYANKYSREILGISKNDDLFDYFDAADSNKIKIIKEELFYKKNIEMNQYELIKKSGERIKVLMKFNLLYKENNIEGIRLAVFELEKTNCNISLIPDKIFYDRYRISEREKDVIMLLLKGLSYKEIAGKLFVSFKTVDKHVSNIYEKTNVNNRFSLINLIRGI